MKNNFCVTAQETGMRLLAFLRERMPHAPSVKAIKRAIERKGCLVNGQTECFSTHFLQKGDRVEIALVEAEKAVSLPVLYEHASFVLIDKPPGIVSDSKILNELLPQYAGTLRLVHRLDKETSGVLLLARSIEAQIYIEDLFATRKVEKKYLAIVDGEIREREGIKDTFLDKKHAYQGQTIWGSGSSGVRAITRWRCLKIEKGISLVECRPLTGRTHQLRVHLSEMGHPVLGDVQYGKRFTSPHRPRRHLLHALEIRFFYEEKEIVVSARLPKDFIVSPCGASCSAFSPEAVTPPQLRKRGL